jgi:hypothetical protein
VLTLKAAGLVDIDAGEIVRPGILRIDGDRIAAVFWHRVAYLYARLDRLARPAGLAGGGGDPDGVPAARGDGRARADP